jgi:ribonuclease E
VRVQAPVTVANFLVNQKREHIAAIELRYGLSVLVEADPALVSPEFRLEKLKTASRPLPAPPSAAISAEKTFAGLPEVEDEDIDDVEEAEVVATAAPTRREEPRREESRRDEPRREEGRRDEARREDRDDAGSRSKRRRGKRGGKKRRRTEGEDNAMRVIGADGGEADPLNVSRSVFGDEVGLEATDDDDLDVGDDEGDEAVVEPVAETAAPVADEAPALTPEPAPEPVPAPVAATPPELEPEPEAAQPAAPATDPDRPRRSGWWSFGTR